MLYNATEIGYDEDTETAWKDAETDLVLNDSTELGYGNGSIMGSGDGSDLGSDNPMTVQS
eukprot:11534070-Ditylum_brightwellii.AAC.1